MPLCAAGSAGSAVAAIRSPCRDHDRSTHPCRSTPDRLRRSTACRHAPSRAGFDAADCNAGADATTAAVARNQPRKRPCPRYRAPFAPTGETSRQAQAQKDQNASAAPNQARYRGPCDRGQNIRLCQPKAWANTVVKQITKTAKRAANGRGTVQIGLTVGPTGNLTAIAVLKSSGDPQIGVMGLDHIRRAAPFPAPPTDANRKLAFAFELR